MALREEFEKQGEWLFRWRSYLPLCIFPFLIIATKDTNNFVNIFGETINLYFNIFCISLSFAGLFLRCYTIGYTFRKTSGRNTKKQRAASLNTTGIYSIIRHPLYLFNFMIYMGFVSFIKVWWFWMISALLLWVYYEKIMYREEEFLRKKFGADYEKWAEKTPAFFPTFMNWEKPALAFSLKKIIKREYPGFLGIIVSFSFVKLILNFINTNKIMLETEWLVFLSAGIVIYTIIRTIHKTTKILKVK